MKKLFPITLVLIVAMILAACGGANNAAENTANMNEAPAVVENNANEMTEEEEMPVEEMAEEEKPSIAAIAAGDENFSTLVTALDAAGLVETLAGEGAFTVFAPTNDAFAALGSDLDAVLADSELLTRVLLYHVVDGVVPAETALTLDGEMVATLSGDEFSVSLKDGNLYIDNAMVTATDIEASNGIIHVIDAVIIPTDEMAEEEKPSIAAIAAGDENFSTLVTALEAANLVDTLAGEGEFTVFAPTNDAFTALFDTVGSLPEVCQPDLSDPYVLLAVLEYHLTRGDRRSTGLVNSGAVRMLNDDVAMIGVDGGGAFIHNFPENARIEAADIRASNGILHLIGRVLIPPAVAQQIQDCLDSQ